MISPNSCPAAVAAAPFDIAITADGSAWITDNLNDSALRLASNGTLVKVVNSLASGIRRPLAIAIDSLGNVWISNSRIIPIEKGCLASSAEESRGNLTPDTEGACISQLNSEGTPARTVACSDVGMKIPWGIAVDGNDNVWVADFDARQLTQICGARPENCPPGTQTGQPIAPAGYFSDALMRNTGLSIDPSGNVWVANNWLLDPVQTNPGGDGLVVFIGLAAPVNTPLIGPPRQP